MSTLDMNMQLREELTVAQDELCALRAEVLACLEPFEEAFQGLDFDDKVRRAWRVPVVLTSDALRAARSLAERLRKEAGG
jgi:hypothetical protein